MAAIVSRFFAFSLTEQNSLTELLAFTPPFKLLKSHDKKTQNTRCVVLSWPPELQIPIYVILFHPSVSYKRQQWWFNRWWEVEGEGVGFYLGIQRLPADWDGFICSLSLSSSSDVSQIYKPAVKQTSYRLLSPLSVPQQLLSWSSSTLPAHLPSSHMGTDNITKPYWRNFKTALFLFWCFVWGLSACGYSCISQMEPLEGAKHWAVPPPLSSDHSWTVHRDESSQVFHCYSFSFLSFL